MRVCFSLIESVKMRKVNVKQRKRLPFLVIRKQKKVGKIYSEKRISRTGGKGAFTVRLSFCFAFFVGFVYVMFYSVTTLLIDLTLNKQFQCVHFLSLAFT